ncbi:glucokinase [Alkalispirochaeta americana]|uniref:Glucokinase n=1 Tax=Alkalispirochaeta americana TaxID=159291 RepID=A0A1N6QHV2_9SPIO|nr:ROK family protein [Alkalispirochaeta americana]SIQ15946.1 glucokinase [Alkalispirochaeta americana]
MADSTIKRTQGADKPVAAVDIGATKTVVARFENDQVHQIARFPTPRDPRELVEQITATLQTASLTGTAIDRVGVGAPGPLDSRAGRFLKLPNLPEWENFPVVTALEEQLEAPVRLENDATAGALGEALYGKGKSYRSMFYITLSTGVGAGLIIDGKIFSGYRGLAGEVHAIDPGTFFGRERGETIIERASGPGMVRSARRLLQEGMASSLREESLDTYTLFAALDQGDPLARQVAQSARDAVAGLLVSVLTIVAPEVIVIGGGLCTESRWLVDPIRERVREALSIPELREIPLERAELWDTAVLFGAAHL